MRIELPTDERALLIEALHTVDRMSVLLNDISAASYRKSGDKEPPKWLHDLLLRRFSDCSGVHLFIAADNIGIPLPKSLRGEEAETT